MVNNCKTLRNDMMSMLERLYNILFLLALGGLEVIAILVLLGSLFFARSVGMIIFGGLLAALLMLAQVFCMVTLEDVGAAMVHNKADNSSSDFFIFFSLISLVLYVPLALARRRRFMRRNILLASK